MNVFIIFVTYYLTHLIAVCRSVWDLRVDQRHGSAVVTGWSFVMVQAQESPATVRDVQGFEAEVVCLDAGFAVNSSLVSGALQCVIWSHR